MQSPSSNKQPISVVIPSFNGRKLLEKHLPSVITELKTGDEIVIVDDASTDDTVSWLQQHFELSSQRIIGQNSIWSAQKIPQKDISLQLVAQANNKRFAASSNHGVSVAQHEFIFLLNNDVELLPGVRNALLKHFEDNTVFAVGCLEYEQKKGDAVSGKNKLWFQRGLFQHSKAEDMSTGPTAWVSGGSGMFSKAKWNELAGFDERFYPAYWEDIDLSYRARKKSWKVLFDAEAQVIHQHESTNHSVFGQKPMQRMSWKNAFLFTRLHATGWQKVQYWLWQPYWRWQQGKS